MITKEQFKYKILPAIKDFLFLFIGINLYSIGYTAFIVENEIVSGGATGIASLIYFSTGIPVSTSYLALNVVLLIIAFKILGGKFTLNTMIGVLGLTMMLYIYENLITVSPISDEPFMAVTIGAFLCGTGLGMIFNSNGSTGGTDIVAAVIHKHKHVSLGQALLLFDVFIISSSYIIFQSIEKIVYGLVFMLIELYIMELVLTGLRQSVQFFIFSHSYDRIADRINHELGRGVTILNAKGWYSKKDAPVLVVLAKKRESVAVFRIVKQEDPNAFISQSIVKGVYGEGFDPIKS